MSYTCFTSTLSRVLPGAGRSRTLAIILARAEKR